MHRLLALVACLLLMQAQAGAGPRACACAGDDDGHRDGRAPAVLACCRVAARRPCCPCGSAPAAPRCCARRAREPLAPDGAEPRGVSARVGTFFDLAPAALRPTDLATPDAALDARGGPRPPHRGICSTSPTSLPRLLI